MIERLTIEEKITKARINIRLVQPFFAYILTNAQFIEENKDVPTMAVDAKGAIYYNRDFVDKLTLEELQGVIIHEIMHVAFLHLIRKGTRDANKWNIANDIVVNNMIMNNRIREFRGTELILNLPKCGLIPEYNSIVMKGTKQIIDDINLKSAEEIYDELEDQPPGTNNNGFDRHIHSDGKKDDGTDEMTKTEERQLEEKWKKTLTEAVIYAQQNGSTPSGMDRMLDKILKPKINWKWMLNKYIISTLPIDTSWKSPNKKSQSVGVYLPNIVKENIEITVAVDLSGSTVHDYNKFISEMITIAKSFSQVKMNVLFWDTEVFKDLEVSNGNIERILTQKMSDAGGGGTSLSCVSDYLLKHNKNPRILVVFTDGYVELNPKPLPVKNVIWVLTKNSSDKRIKHLPGKIVRMSDEDED